MIRDRVTVTGYALVATWAFFLYFVGPVSPILAASYEVPVALVGLSGTALAVGYFSSGLVGPKLVGRLGRLTAARLALLLLAAGGALLALAPWFALALLAIAGGALAGGLMANVATAVLADRHGPSGARAITEANALAAWIGLISPALIGAVVAMGWGWRPAAAAVSVVALAMWLFTAALPRDAFGAEASAHSDDSDPARPEAATGSTPIEPVRGPFYWALATVLVAVSVEICMSIWGGVLISSRTGADLATTTAAIAAMIAGIAVGRTAGAGLTRHRRTRTLVLCALGVAAAGFVVVLASSAFPLSVAGLFLYGIGLALLYPLTQALAISHASGRHDLAVGIIAVVVGLAMGVTPFVLGALSGGVGVTSAFLIIPLMLAIGALAVTQADTGDDTPQSPDTGGAIPG